MQEAGKEKVAIEKNYKKLEETSKVIFQSNRIITLVQLEIQKICEISPKNPPEMCLISFSAQMLEDEISDLHAELENSVSHKEVLNTRQDQG